MKKGLVLEGGGTKGAYQIGAYEALRDLGIKITGIARDFHRSIKWSIYCPR
ncbi:MAG: patatin-like phospholipase family protein [Terrisporobacter sp.]